MFVRRVFSFLSNVLTTSYKEVIKIKILYLRKQLEQLKGYQTEVINNIAKIIDVLNENYRVERNIEYDLGGYVLLGENIMDIEMLKSGKLDGLEAEYTDLIECKEGVNYTSSLFLLSSDYAIVVVTTEELSMLLID